MEILRRKLQEEAKNNHSRLDIIQQDYLLTWILKSLSQNEILRNNLVFKGGTALKKCYFGKYRFSEDLDFTAKENAPKGKILETAVSQICKHVEESMGQYGIVNVFSKVYREKQRHPHGQEAFTIYAQFPWQKQPLTRVMIEVTYSEELLLLPIERDLIHPYGNELNASILTYSLDEIILEKLRAILQQTKKLHERTWSRSRARDYYDLWHILCISKYSPDINSFQDLLIKKCHSKDVHFSAPEDFFSPILITNVTNT